MPEIVLNGVSDPANPIVITSSNIISTPYFITALTYYSSAIDINNTIEVWVSPDDSTDPNVIPNGVRFFPSSLSPGSVVPSTFSTRFRSDFLSSSSASYLKLRHVNTSGSNISVVVIVEIQIISEQKLARLRL